MSSETTPSLVEDETDDTKKEKPLASFSEVFSFAKSSKSRTNLAIGLFASVLSGLIQPAIAIIFALSFENFANVVDSNGLKWIVYSFLIVGIYAFLSMTVQTSFLETAAAEMTDTLKKEWFDALLRQDIAYYDVMDISGTATIINSNGIKFRRGLGRKMGDGIQFTVTALGGLAFGFWCSVKLSLILIGIVPLLAAATGLLMKLNQSKTLRANKSYAKAGSIVYSSVSSIRTILSLNAVEEVIGKFEEATQEAYLGATKHVVHLGAANGVVMAVFLFAYLPLTLYGSYLLYSDVGETGCDPSGVIEANESCSVTAFHVFGCLMGITFAGAVIPIISGSLESFVDAQSACYPALVAIYRKTPREGQSEKSLQRDEAMRESLQKRSANTSIPPYAIDSSSPDGSKPKTVEGRIEFKDVSFRYPTRLGTDVYNGLNFEIKPGTTVALCGPSGGGKSTIIQLLERFYDPCSGSITLDGIDLRNLNVQWLRKQIGLVSQEPKLFAMSIGDNIKVGRPSATFEEIRAAAKRANANEFIESFPQGYDTMVGDEGSQLSGGQKQRIAIARALIMKPKIILLDEATSALDSEAEVVVQEALDNLIEEDGGNRTIIVIAHRLSTIKNADTIAVLSGGVVAEKGKHAELIAKRGLYYGLVEAQKGKGREGSGGIQKPTKSETANANGVEGIPTTQASAATNTSGYTDDIITFQEVQFKYPSRPEDKIFDGLEMSVKKGETLAIVGPSGQGKSTVIQLIQQFYRPEKGCLLYKGIPMIDLNVAWLRSQMSLVSQEPVLYDISVKENIRFGLATATEKDIERVAKKANCHDFITSFPDGYDTVVGSTTNAQISGGQKQRIAIARALLRNPKILLLDEATSSLDSESERIVQSALDKITTNSNRTVVQIAHRLSTIRNSDRIVVLNKGKVRESGTHEELMALKGHYHQIVGLQNLDDDTEREAYAKRLKADTLSSSLMNSEKNIDNSTSGAVERFETIMDKSESNAKKARRLAKGDGFYFLIGGIGALVAGLIFPGWGFTFAFMIELLYFNPVFPCDGPNGISPFNSTCQEYWDETREKMRDSSFEITYIYIALMIFALIGNILLFYGFGTATERLNKRVRDASFKSLMRQEVAYFDTRPAGAITSQLSDDAAMIHSFSGEPIRTLIMNLGSLVVGLVLSFFYMWPFALVALSVLPFMAFGAEAEQRMYMGEDESSDEDEKNSGVIVIESLTNIRTVASLSLEASRSEQFAEALHKEDPKPLWTNFMKGASSGLGPLFQEWCFALLIWWGGWLITNHPNLYSSRGFVISMFSLLFSLSAMATAAQGATDRSAALSAAQRTFDLMERESQIDPLSIEGKKNV
jgi:ATP-binding cassette subfamily B (MDR/TAP) protein 1